MELPIYFESLMQRTPIPPSDLSTFLREMRRTPSGALVTSKLLAGKIQSTSEAQAIHAFDFLEACLEAETEGSIEFRTEIGRYRFLNEIIRILSPKFLGDQTTSAVKERAVNFLYDASGVKRRRWFPSEHSKIETVYQSLVDSNVIPKNPKDNSVEADAEAELQKSIFDRAENAAILKKLLQSKDPSDLQAANRLIKNLVDEETKRIERRAELHSLIDQIETSTSLLTEMLGQRKIDKEIVDELVEGCRTLRQKLGGVPAETTDEATSLLQASENIEEVLKFYEKRKNEKDEVVDDTDTDQAASRDFVKPVVSLADELLMGLGDFSLEDLNPGLKPSVVAAGGDNLLNLDIEVSSSGPSSISTKDEQKSPGTLDEIGRMSRELMEKSLMGVQPFVAVDTKKSDKTPLNQLVKPNHVTEATSPVLPLSSMLTDNMLLDLDFLEKHENVNTTTSNSAISDTTHEAQARPIIGSNNPTTVPKVPTEKRRLPSSGEDDHLLLVLGEAKSPKSPVEASQTEEPAFCLNSIKELDLEKIDLIDDLEPVSLPLDESSGVDLRITFGKYPEFPCSVHVAVITLTNNSHSDSLLNYVFQLMPPKGVPVKVKLMPPSCMELPARKKIFLPAPVLTQVALLVCPKLQNTSPKPKIKYILSFCQGEDTALHNGDFEIPSHFFS